MWSLQRSQYLHSMCMKQNLSESESKNNKNTFLIPLIHPFPAESMDYLNDSHPSWGSDNDIHHRPSGIAGDRHSSGIDTRDGHGISSSSPHASSDLAGASSARESCGSNGSDDVAITSSGKAPWSDREESNQKSRGLMESETHTCKTETQSSQRRPAMATRASTSGTDSAGQDSSLRTSSTVSESWNESSSKTQTSSGSHSSSSVAQIQGMPFKWPGHLTSWQTGRFERVKVFREATESWPCHVELHFDKESGTSVSVKRFPGRWIQKSPEAFCKRHGAQGRNPWQEIFLAEWMWKMRCAPPLPVLPCFGVFIDKLSGDIMLPSSEVLHQDLFSFCAEAGPCGNGRTTKVFPVFKALLQAVFSLHDMGIAHGCIRAETVWLHKEDAEVEDFQATLTNFTTSAAHASLNLPSKLVFEAPGDNRDPQASDLFACGILGFALATGKYPWTSTCPGACKSFDLAKRDGFKEFFRNKKCPASRSNLCEEYENILACLLELDPTVRLMNSRNLRNCVSRRSS